MPPSRPGDVVVVVLAGLVVVVVGDAGVGFENGTRPVVVPPPVLVDPDVDPVPVETAPVVPVPVAVEPEVGEDVVRGAVALPDGWVTGLAGAAEPVPGVEV